jgi:hypothetical protein
MLATLRPATKEKSSQRAGYKPPPKPWKGRQGSKTPGGKKENKCYRCRKLGHFKRKCPEGKKDKMLIPTMSHEEEWGGKGLFYMDGSYRDPLINFKVGPKERGHIFVDSRLA